MSLTTAVRKSLQPPSIFGKHRKSRLVRKAPRHRFDHPMLDPDFLVVTLDLQADLEGNRKAQRINESLKRVFR